jgi:opacity protein-like surface antigen
MNGKLAFAKVAAVSVLALWLGVPANAADLAVRPGYTKAPPMIQPPLYNWTGFYVGANFGGSFSSETISGAAINNFSTDPSGVMGGVQLGYNHQFSPNWLLGLEGELSWTSAQNSASVGATTFTSNHNWYDTLTPRLGYVQNNWLFFVKGGAAWMNADYSVAALSGSTNVTRSGWTIGAGAEYMLAPGWSAKLEYDYLDFGNDGFSIGATALNANTQVHEVKVGVNYHFMPGTLFGRF